MGLNYISINDFKVGDIAYVIKDTRYPSHAYPVKVLEINKSNVTTTAPPIDLRYVGVGFRNKFVFKRIPFTDNCPDLYLEKQRYPITILLPSIEHIRERAKRSRYEKFRVDNFMYSTQDNNYIEAVEYYDTKDSMRTCLINHISKTGIKRSDVAIKLGRNIQSLNDFLKGYPMVFEISKNDLKELLIEFGYDIKKYDGEEK